MPPSYWDKTVTSRHTYDFTHEAWEQATEASREYLATLGDLVSDMRRAHLREREALERIIRILEERLARHEPVKHRHLNGTEHTHTFETVSFGVSGSGHHHGDG